MKTSAINDKVRCKTFVFFKYYFGICFENNKEKKYCSENVNGGSIVIGKGCCFILFFVRRNMMRRTKRNVSGLLVNRPVFVEGLFLRHRRRSEAPTLRSITRRRVITHIHTYISENTTA